MTEPDRENDAGPITRHTPVVSNYGLVLTVYILYLAGFLTGITVLVGLIIAYLQRDKTDRVSQSHFQFQITTFWIGLLYFFAGLGVGRSKRRAFRMVLRCGCFRSNQDPFGAAWCSLCTAGYARIEEALIEPANTKERDAEPYH
jgi:hypothetical protein